MSDQQTPKYHLAPNFSIPPVEAGGVLTLGSLIPNIATADDPINVDCHVHIPTCKLFCSHQTGFSATRARMSSGEYGIWAKFVDIGGVGSGGGELSWAPEKSAEDVFHFRAIDTVYFNPSQEYLEESMGKDDVKEYMEGSGSRAVYMVTGLKTARGASLKTHKTAKRTAAAELGLKDLGGLSAGVGSKLAASKEVRQGMGFEDSTDFIVGIRVKKLMYKKHWLTWRATGPLVAKEHNNGATMVGNDTAKKSYDEVVGLDDDLEGPGWKEAEGIHHVPSQVT
jgi:hypothetical protein